VITPHAAKLGAKGSRPSFAVETMLRIHFLQQCFNLSDPAAEEALHDAPVFEILSRWASGWMYCRMKALFCFSSICLKDMVLRVKL